MFTRESTREAQQLWQLPASSPKTSDTRRRRNHYSNTTEQSCYGAAGSASSPASAPAAACAAGTAPTLACGDGGPVSATAASGDAAGDAAGVVGAPRSANRAPTGPQLRDAASTSSGLPCATTRPPSSKMALSAAVTSPSEWDTTSTVRPSCVGNHRPQQHRMVRTGSGRGVHAHCIRTISPAERSKPRALHARLQGRARPEVHPSQRWAHSESKRPREVSRGAEWEVWHVWGGGSARIHYAPAASNARCTTDDARPRSGYPLEPRSSYHSPGDWQQQQVNAPRPTLGWELCRTLGSFAMVSWMPAAVAAASSSSWLASGRANRRFAATVSLSRNDSCGMKAARSQRFNTR